MQKTKLFLLFSKLSKWETNHFEAFLTSPYFNKRKDVIQLFHFLKEKQVKKEAVIAKQDAYFSAYPKKEFQEKEAYLLFSYLYKLLEEFLSLQQIRKDKALIKLYTARAYQELKLSKGFEQKISESKNILNKSNLRNSEYLRKNYDLENEYYNYLGSNQRSGENNLEALGNAFDIYYISEKIRHHCFQLSHQAVSGKEYKSKMLDQIISIVENDVAYLEYPPIAVYFFYYKALSSQDDDSNFVKFRQTIDEFEKHFTSTELRDIYLAAINVCIRRANQGGLVYVSETFELYKTGIEKNILIENGELSPFAFKNIMSAGRKLGKLDYLESFIAKYQNNLNSKVRKGIVCYSTAILRYEQKRYQESMELLKELETDDYLLTISGKTTLLKIYYELEELDALEALLESLRIYLQRNKQIGYHKDVYKNIIQLTKKLVALPAYDKKKKKALMEKVMVMQPLSFRKWFLEQLENKR